MGWDDVDDSACPVARALAIVGDRWTLLIVRELFFGTRRFDDLQALSGASSHLLATRLRRLEEDGVVERRQYNDRPPRYEYTLTPKGRDLQPVMFALRSWGAKWHARSSKEEPALSLVHASCGTPVEAAMICPSCGEPCTNADLRASFGKTFAAERRARLDAFQARKRSD